MVSFWADGNTQDWPAAISLAQRTPNPPKPDAFKVLHVYGGELGDALGDHGEGAAGIVQAAEGEGFGGGHWAVLHAEIDRLRDESLEAARFQIN